MLQKYGTSFRLIFLRRTASCSGDGVTTSHSSIVGFNKCVTILLKQHQPRTVNLSYGLVARSDTSFGFALQTKVAQCELTWCLNLDETKLCDSIR
jgi:hypothetical protein